MTRRFWLTAMVVACAALQGTGAQAQQQGGTIQTDKVQPVNGGANPYRVIRDWAQLNLEGRPWGGSNGVAIDRDGKFVWPHGIHVDRDGHVWVTDARAATRSSSIHKVA